MAEIINLRQERKRRERRQQEREAAENRSKFGLPRAERTRVKDERERQRTKLDGHKLEDDRLAQTTPAPRGTDPRRPHRPAVTVP